MSPATFALLIVGVCLSALAATIIQVGARRERRRPWAPAYGRSDARMGLLTAFAALGGVICLLAVYFRETGL